MNPRDDSAVFNRAFPLYTALAWQTTNSKQTEQREQTGASS